MSVSDRWLLPDGIEELLPQEARRVEAFRSALFELYRTWGYELVITPLVEYVESLSVGAGSDLEKYTFQLVDQLNGRMLAVRSDITPQVARIDAHRLKRQGPARLCYWGPVLTTRPRELGGTRSPLQVGAELYGHAGVESDVEILNLMIKSLHLTGLRDPYLDLGHVGIFKGLVRQAGLNTEQEDTLFDALQRKAKPEITALLTSVSDKAVADMLSSLADLNGGEEILQTAEQVLAQASDEVKQALHIMKSVATSLRQRHGEHLNMHFDFAELRGYSYHTGLVFAAYAPGYGQAVAQGGRYDAIGSVFGRSRPATGFSLDLRSLLAMHHEQDDIVGGIFAPADKDETLHAKVAELRAQGERVVCELPGQQGGAADVGCDRVLLKAGNKWVVETLEKAK